MDTARYMVHVSHACAAGPTESQNRHKHETPIQSLRLSRVKPCGGSPLQGGQVGHPTAKLPSSTGAHASAGAHVDSARLPPHRYSLGRNCGQSLENRVVHLGSQGIGRSANHRSRGWAPSFSSSLSRTQVNVGGDPNRHAAHLSLVAQWCVLPLLAHELCRTGLSFGPLVHALAPMVLEGTPQRGP